MRQISAARRRDGHRGAAVTSMLASLHEASGQIAGMSSAVARSI